jgi:U2 small nuclear ribonucleoprotein A'
LSVLENPVTRKEVRPKFPVSVSFPISLNVPLTGPVFQNYRLWIIWLNPHIRFLDFQKVKDAERAKATSLFGTHEQPSELASKTLGKKSRTFDVPGGEAATAAGGRGGVPAPSGDKAIRVKLTDKERKRVEKMIREAKSLQEITRLERELNEGRIPRGAADEDEDEDVAMKM